MTLNRFSKTALLLGTAAVLMACSDSTAEKSVTETVKTQTTDQKSEKRPYKMISYETAGQTDADHLYLEEVLGEAALDEVKAWN
jgi:prolyl oligopeptidase